MKNCCWDEEVNYLFQLANEAQEYTANVQAKLDTDILKVKKAVEYAQRDMNNVEWSVVTGR